SISEYDLTWAGMIPVDVAYNWDPTTFLEELPQESILGIEAPLWSETISNSAELEYLAFPRAIGFAEMGWSPAAHRNWDEYKLRLAKQVPYLSRMDVNFYRTKLVDWPE
ncbi:MAG: family 20 glycosylhydrolase, partial [Allomuricauda sp.]